MCCLWVSPLISEDFNRILDVTYDFSTLWRFGRVSVEVRLIVVLGFDWCALVLMLGVSQGLVYKLVSALINWVFAPSPLAA